MASDSNMQKSMLQAFETWDLVMTPHRPAPSAAVTEPPGGTGTQATEDPVAAEADVPLPRKLTPNAATTGDLRGAFAAMSGDAEGGRDDVLEERQLAALAAANYQVVNGHTAQAGPSEVPHTAMLKARGEAVLQDMAYWHHKVGYTSIDETFGREPVDYDTVEAAAASNGGVLPLEFLGRWCPICYLVECASRPKPAAVLKDIMDYFEHHANQRPAALHRAICQLYNASVVKPLAQKQMTLDKLFASVVVTDGTPRAPRGKPPPPLVDAVFMESHFEGGPCMRQNAFYVVNVLREYTVARIDYINKAGIFVTSPEGQPEFAPKLSAAQMQLERHLLYLEQKSVEAAAQLFTPWAAEEQSSKRRRTGPVRGLGSGSANVLRAQESNTNTDR